MAYTGLNPTFSSIELPATGEISIASSPAFYQGIGSTNNFFIGAGAGNTGAGTLGNINNLGVGVDTLAEINSTSYAFSNTAVGAAALRFVTGSGSSDGTGSNNTAVGVAALTNLTTGLSNVAVGSINNTGALNGLTTGGYNVAVGPGVGDSYTGAESNNILIGFNVGEQVGENGVIRIGEPGGTQTACYVQGIHGVTVATSTAVLIGANGQMGTVLSSERFKENIQEMPSTNVMSLRPVTFNYKSDESKSKQFGLIAEEVDKVMPEIVLYDDNKQPHSVQYHVLPAILLSEIQKLNKRIEALEKK